MMIQVDDRIIRADLDPGFEDERQYGRSKRTGGQLRDDYRDNYDAGRGGWGLQAELTESKRPLTQQPHKSSSSTGSSSGPGKHGGRTRDRASRDTGGRDRNESRGPSQGPSKRHKTSDN